MKNTPQQQECDLWGDLDSNVLGEIFSRLPIHELFLTVSSVCQSWEAACWNYLFWSRNVLDLSTTGGGLGRVDIFDVASLEAFKSDPLPGVLGQLSIRAKKYSFNDMASCLSRKLRRIMEGQNISWRDSIHTVILPYELEVSDTFLLYIAERTPRVKRLLLMCPYKITPNGFATAFQKWKYVNEIHVGPLINNVFVHFIEELGRYCEGLVTLHIHQFGFTLNEISARMIANNLPALKKIGFELGRLHPSGVTTLYKMCLQMEAMYVDACRMDNPAVVTYEEAFNRGFHLTWRVDSRGDPKWELELLTSPIKVELYKKSFERCGINCTIEDRMSFISLESQKTTLQSEFEWWVDNASVYPRRK